MLAPEIIKLLHSEPAAVPRLSSGWPSPTHSMITVLQLLYCTEQPCWIRQQTYLAQHFVHPVSQQLPLGSPQAG